MRPRATPWKHRRVISASTHNQPNDMKGLSITRLVTILVTIGLGTIFLLSYMPAFVPQAHAEVDQENLPLTTQPLGSTACTYTTNPDHTCYQGSAKVTVSQSNQVSKTDASQGQCLYWFGLNLVQCGWDLGTWIASVFLEFSIFFLALAGTLLDTALQYLAFNMGAILQVKTVRDAVTYGWTIFRDLGNIALIAGLIWASISMILQTNAGSNPPGKLIVNIIIVALLVNFSYFFAGVLIDASNSLSNVIYQQGIKGMPMTSGIVVPTTSQSSTLDQFNSALTTLNQSLSVTKVPFTGLFIQETGLLSVIHTNQDKSKPLSTIIAMGYATTLITTTAVVFTEATFLIVVRFAILILLLITSPIFIFGFTNLGELKKWGDWWLKTLVSQLTFLPAFMLLMMISFNTIGKTMAFATSQSGGATLGTAIDATTGSTSGALASGFELTIFFFVSLALLQISIKVARDLASGAETKLPDLGQFQQMASKAGQAVGKFGQKYIALGPAEVAGAGYNAVRPYLPSGDRFGKEAGRVLRTVIGQGRDVARERRADARTEHEG